jgi:hypothetical protein
LGAGHHPQRAALSLLGKAVATLAQLLPSLSADINTADRRPSEIVGRQVPAHFASLFGDSRGFGGSEPIAPYPASALHHRPDLIP